jgi:hypothetical protein
VRLRASNYALPLCLAAMDGCWIYMAAWLIGAAGLPESAGLSVPPPVLAALELAAWWLAAALLDRTQLSAATAQGLAGVAGVLTSLALVAVTHAPADGAYSWQWVAGGIYSLIICLTMWGIGVRRASAPPEFNSVFAGFRAGLIAAAVAAVFAVMVAGSRQEALRAGVGGLPLWFFAWSLLALALGNRELVRRESGNPGRSSIWVAVAAVSIGIVLLGSALAGIPGGQDLLSLAGQVLRGIVLLVALVAYGLLSIWFWILSLFDGLLATPAPGAPRKPAQPPQTPKFTTDWLERLRRDWETNRPPTDIPPELLTAITWLVIGATVLALVWAISRGMKRARLHTTRDAGEEREPFGTWDLLWQQVKTWIAMLLARFRRSRAAAPATPVDDLAALRMEAAWQGTLSVREIYARLQALAARVGYPRAPQQTPIEYMRLLSTAIPTLERDLRDITDAYLVARYGPLPASAPAVSSATNAWRRIEPVLGSIAGRPVQP